MSLSLCLCLCVFVFASDSEQNSMDDGLSGGGGAAAPPNALCAPQGTLCMVFIYIFYILLFK